MRIISSLLIVFLFLITGCAGDYSFVDQQRNNLLEKQGVIAFPDSTALCGGDLGDTHFTNGQKDREPLMASIPFLTDSVFTSGLHNRDSNFETVGRQADVQHDYCYISGEVTYSKDQKQCDKDFSALSTRICSAGYTSRIGCNTVKSHLPYWGVNQFGNSFYDVSMKSVCEYERNAGWFKARSQLVPMQGRAVLVEDNTEGNLLLSTITVNATSNPYLINVVQKLSDIHAARPFNITGKTFLHHNPMAVDLDGDGKQELVLIGMDTPDEQTCPSEIERPNSTDSKREDDDCGNGVVMIVVENPATNVQRVTAFAVSMGKAKSQLRQQATFLKEAGKHLERNSYEMLIEAFTHPILAGHFVDGTPELAQQLLLPSLNVRNDSGAIDLRLYQFIKNEKGNFSLSMYRQQYIDDARYAENDRNNELYKRFQYPAEVFDVNMDGLDDVHFFIRPKEREIHKGNGEKHLRVLRYSYLAQKAGSSDGVLPVPANAVFKDGTIRHRERISEKNLCSEGFQPASGNGYRCYNWPRTLEPIAKLSEKGMFAAKFLSNQDRKDSQCLEIQGASHDKPEVLYAAKINLTAAENPISCTQITGSGKASENIAEFTDLAVHTLHLKKGQADNDVLFFHRVVIPEKTLEVLTYNFYEKSSDYYSCSLENKRVFDFDSRKEAARMMSSMVIPSGANGSDAVLLLGKGKQKEFLTFDNKVASWKLGDKVCSLQKNPHDAAAIYGRGGKD